ncbi:four helix bundle protein [Hydrogenimonas urashimensis]|uniref:four helix bundle protein n=1 Tax=Hydrogenimonas urashimensis TaxID=2740515 RepID=UPI0019152519|nr:four helix bundle protein [Hydrogenimonas urashimensis]
MRENESLVRGKSYKFALRIIKLCRWLQAERSEYILTKQLMRSGTAIGALIYEAEFAQSKADFVNKLNIALKEANETNYWLMLLHDAEYINDKMFQSIEPDNKELIKLLVSSIKTLKTSG